MRLGTELLGPRGKHTCWEPHPSPSGSPPPPGRGREGGKTLFLAGDVGLPQPWDSAWPHPSGQAFGTGWGGLLLEIRPRQASPAAAAGTAVGTEPGSLGLEMLQFSDAN